MYAHRKRTPDDRSVWYPVTVDEFKAWVAVILNMGIVQKPTIHLYWRKTSTIQTPFFPSIMSRDRFLQITRYLHFTDNQEEVTVKNSPHYDKLFKVRKLLDLFLPRLSEVYHLERNLAVDETLVELKGRLTSANLSQSSLATLASNVLLLLSQVVGMPLSVKFTLGRNKGCNRKILTEEWSWI